MTPIAYVMEASDFQEKERETERQREKSTKDKVTRKGGILFFLKFAQIAIPHPRSLGIKQTKDQANEKLHQLIILSTNQMLFS